MEDKTRCPLVWLDMEMTGLDPATCVPLQVAVVITNDELEEQDSVEVTIWQPEEALARIDPFVRKMHTENGLLEHVRQSEIALNQAERAVMGVITKWCPYGEALLAGNSIHTDRRFLIRYFPAVEGFLHYRMIDVSSLKELVVRWYGREATFNKSLNLHTALADVRESIAELRHYRSLVMRPAPLRP
jgi:oligoribonuclease